jgi:hypothetical protein
MLEISNNALCVSSVVGRIYYTYFESFPQFATMDTLEPLSDDFFGEELSDFTTDEHEVFTILASHMGSDADTTSTTAPTTAQRQNHSTWVTIQPETPWFQFEKSALVIAMKTDNPGIIQDGWTGATLQLLYQDTMTEVTTTKAKPVFKLVEQSVVGDTITFKVKVNEVSRTHQNRLFCFSFAIGELIIVTNSFRVKSKITRKKRKREHAPPLNESDYRIQTRNVLRHLQWRISGYSSSCEGSVDFKRPIFTCAMCNGQREYGHTTGCPIIALL